MTRLNARRLRGGMMGLAGVVLLLSSTVSVFASARDCYNQASKQLNEPANAFCECMAKANHDLILKGVYILDKQTGQTIAIDSICANKATNKYCSAWAYYHSYRDKKKSILNRESWISFPTNVRTSLNSQVCVSATPTAGQSGCYLFEDKTQRFIKCKVE